MFDKGGHWVGLFTAMSTPLGDPRGEGDPHGKVSSCSDF